MTGLVAGVVVMTSPISGKGGEDDSKRPNIIFMFSDDHTAQAIGAYQGELDYGLRLENTPTPHIDRLAEEGMRFDNAFVSNSICKPSRAVLLTGLHSHLNGVPTNGESIDPGLLTFPKILQRANYETAIVGKWHLGTAPQGFDYYEVLHGQGPYYNPTMRTPDGDVARHGHTSEIITERAINWLKHQRSKDQPFMLMFNHKAPHRNWLPGPKHLKDYQDRDVPEPDTLFYDYSGLESPAHRQDMEIATTMRWGWDLKVPKNPASGEPANGWQGLINRNNLTDSQLETIKSAYGPENQALYEEYESMTEKERVRWRYQRYIKDYLRVIRGIDDGVGRLLAYLERAGLAENTVVVYSGDQGFFLGENGWFDKRWIYEESLRMPFIVRWPKEIEAGSVDKHLVQNLDYAPTLLDLAGAEIPEAMQGSSLVPLLKGKSPSDWRDAVYYHYYEGVAGPHDVRRHYGLRTKRYTLAHYYKDGVWELFDLKKDPEQLKSVYGKSEYAAVQRRLKRKLTELQERYGDDNPQEPVSAIVARQRMEQIESIEVQEVLRLQSGDSEAPQNLNPSLKPLTVGAWVKPATKNGAVISRGGASLGYMLSIDNGRPAFAIRSNGVLKRVVADQALTLNEPAHLVGLLDKEGRLRLYVNGDQVAEGPGHFVGSNPSDGLSVGADAGSKVGSQSGNLEFEGALRDIRVYWGVLGSQRIKDWAAKAPELE